jgi:hypothetical protein
MFSFLKSLTEQETFTPNVPVYNGTNGTVSPTGTGTMAAGLDQNSDVAFKNARIGINNDKDVTASDVTGYLDAAKEINDGVECVGFAVELDDGQLVKMYVNKEDAQKFEDDLAAALGAEEEFEDAILRFADVYDVVDVIWPDNTYGTQSEVVGDPAVAAPAIGDQPPMDTKPDAPPSDSSDLQSKISQDADVVDPASTDSPTGTDSETPPADTDSAVDAEKPPADGEPADLDSAMDAFNKSFDDEQAADDTVSADGAEPTDTDTGEEKPRSHHKKEESDEGGESDAEKDADGEEKPRSHHKKADNEEDDDVSVVIHPKKKSVTESKEEPEIGNSSSMFQVMGLDSQFSIMGAKIESLIGKRILAVLGFIGIPGSMLVNLTNLEESINEHSQTISANANTRANFNKIFHRIIETPRSEKFTDAEYKVQFTKFLKVLGIDLTAVKSTRQAISAVLFGAYCISSNAEAKVAFHAFMDNFDDTESEEQPIKESYEDSDDGYRTYDDFASMMRGNGSTYRDWMTVKLQRELANWYCSGSDVHVIIVDQDEDPKSHIPHGCHLYATSPEHEGMIEIVCLEKPTAVINYGRTK